MESSPILSVASPELENDFLIALLLCAHFLLELHPSDYLAVIRRLNTLQHLMLLIASAGLLILDLRIISYCRLSGMERVCRNFCQQAYQLTSKLEFTMSCPATLPVWWQDRDREDSCTGGCLNQTQLHPCTDMNQGPTAMSWRSKLLPSPHNTHLSLSLTYTCRFKCWITSSNDLGLYLDLTHQCFPYFLGS